MITHIRSVKLNGTTRQNSYNCLAYAAASTQSNRDLQNRKIQEKINQIRYLKTLFFFIFFFRGIHAGVASSNWLSVNTRTSEPSACITHISP